MRYNPVTKSAEAATPPPAKPPRTPRQSPAKAASSESAPSIAVVPRVMPNPPATGAGAAVPGASTPLGIAAARVPQPMIAHLATANGGTATPEQAADLHTAFIEWCDAHTEAHTDWRSAWSEFWSTRQSPPANPDPTPAVPSADESAPTCPSGIGPTPSNVIEHPFNTRQLLEAIQALA